YDARAGRFAAFDPELVGSGESKSFQRVATSPQALNAYAYVENRPTAAIDPMGRSMAELLGRMFAAEVERAEMPAATTAAISGRPSPTTRLYRGVHNVDGEITLVSPKMANPFRVFLDRYLNPLSKGYGGQFADRRPGIPARYSVGSHGKNGVFLI